VAMSAGERWHQMEIRTGNGIVPGLLCAPSRQDHLPRSGIDRGLDDPPRCRLHRRAGGRTIPARPADPGFDNAPLGRTVQHVLADIVDVDLHPARPGRARITGHLPDPDIDEAALGAFSPNLVAEEFRAGPDPYRQVEGERFTRFRALGIERPAVLGLKAVSHTLHRFVDHDSHADFGLVSALHAATVGAKSVGSKTGKPMSATTLPRGRRRSGGGHAARFFSPRRRRGRMQSARVPGLRPPLRSAPVRHRSAARQAGPPWPWRGR